MNGTRGEKHSRNSAQLKGNACKRWTRRAAEGGREGVLDVQSEGESGREFRREATRIHCKEEGGEKEKERVYGGM